MMSGHRERFATPVFQTLTLAVPSTFTAYNVEEMAPVETAKQNYTYSFGTINISNVPLAPNTHVVLNGDVANSGLTTGDITATVDNEWSDSSQNF